MVQIVDADTEQRIESVRELWSDYWNALGFTPSFQGFAEELSGLPGKYRRPEGRLLLALLDGQPAGTVAFRRRDADACEAKRLYVAETRRGHGIGRLLMDRLIEEARSAGYRRIVGDTMPVMANALAMYERMGFRRTAPYAGATEGAIYIEYAL